MSEEKKNRPGGVRRIGEKDRKSRLEAGGPLFPGDTSPSDASPPSELPPPTLPEDVPDSELSSAETETSPDEVIAAAAAEEQTRDKPSLSDAALSDDTASLLDEIETNIEAVAPVEADAETPEEHARFKRPAAPPTPYDAQQDRFPPLPDEYVSQPRLKAPPRPQAAPAPRKRGGLVLNCLTLIFVLASCGLVGIFAYLWQNPYSALNPFPPFTPLPIVVSQTFTPTLTFTPTDTPLPTSTPTPLPTDTPTPEVTDTPEADAEAAEVTETAGAAFSLQGGQTIYITNPDGRGGCRWSSIAGTVLDVGGGALNDYQIRVLGNGVDETVISGTASGYGPGGFEVQLGNEAVDAEYAVQLLDPDGAPVSDAFTVNTSSRCDWNISVLRFVQNP